MFVWLPTGYGKSMCYSTISLTGDNSAVLVVSPLLLLMMDQMEGVQAETAGFRYSLERCHADDVESNLAHAI